MPSSPIDLLLASNSVGMEQTQRQLFSSLWPHSNLFSSCHKSYFSAILGLWNQLSFLSFAPYYQLTMIVRIIPPRWKQPLTTWSTCTCRPSCTSSLCISVPTMKTWLKECGPLLSWVGQGEVEGSWVSLEDARALWWPHPFPGHAETIPRWAGLDSGYHGSCHVLEKNQNKAPLDLYAWILPVQIPVWFSRATS